MAHHLLHEQAVVGCQEWVGLPALGIKQVLAKIDTGAYTGALHCENIKVIKKDGQRMLRFQPLSASHRTVETTEFFRVEVTSASGHASKRWAIPIELVIQGQRYKTFIGLTKRESLRRQMLIGRRFLKDNQLLVDVRKNQHLADERDTQ